MGKLVALNTNNEEKKLKTEQSIATTVAQGRRGKLMQTGSASAPVSSPPTVYRTSPVKTTPVTRQNVVMPKTPTQGGASPMFRQQNVVTPKNQNALAQGLGKGALQQQEAKNYQSEKAFNQHVKDVKPQTVTQRVGNTLKGAAKTYGAGFANLSGVAAQGQGGTAMSPVYRAQAETLDQQIAALEATLSDPSMTAQDIADTKEAIAIARSEREKYGKIIESGERAAAGAYDIADRLADSGAKDINKAKSGLGKVGQLAVDAGVAGAQMGMDIALTPFMGGSALFPMFMRSAGGGAQQARRAGATHEQQVNYGLASGALSVATEKIGNAAAPFKKMFGRGFLDSVIERTMSGLNNSAAGKIALSFIEEGGEEVIEDLVQPALQMIYNGKTLGGSYSELEAAEVLNDFLVGGILGGIGGGVEAAANRFARFDNSLGESGRKAIRGSYQEGEDTAQHVKDFIPAYNAGVEGKANPNPTNETAYAGYVAGQNDAKKEAGTGEHIDGRTKENVSSRNVNAFQFDHPELHGYYSTAAEQIAGIADISLSRGQQKGARQRTANGYQRNNQIFETPAMRKAMNEGLTRTQIIDAAQRIINDNGQENVKAAKTLEIVLDDMLTNGYTAVDGTAVAPNTDYIAAKQQIAGAEVQATGFDKYVTDNRLALETGDVTMDELRTEYAQQEGAEHGEAVHLRNGSERDNGADPRGEVRGVEEGAGRNPGRKEGRHFADSEAASLDYGEKVSTASFGIGRGAFNDSVYLVKNETAEMRKAKDLAKERGLRVTFFAGNNLTFRDKSGKTFQVRGYVSGDRVFIRADHPEFTSYQIMRHEAGHDMIAKGEVDLNEVRTRIDKTFTGGEVDSLCTAYADAYAGTEMTAQEIWEEVVCDSLGDMNIFADSEISDAAAFLLAHIKVESETVAQESTRAPPSKINGRASIEEAADGKKYVRADRQVIFGNDPQSWSEQLEDYINGKIRRGQDVKLIGADGDELVLTATSAGKLSDNHTSDGRTMSEAAFERKVNAASHIDELAQVSVKGDRNVVDHNSRHGDMASSGWNYRTAFFKDFDGKYYKVTISTAQSADGKMIYNIGQMQERSIPQINGSSAADSGALRGNASVDSLSRGVQNVKLKFSMETPVEETDKLIAVHNKDEASIMSALKLGGLPMPSIAIVKARDGHTKYGPISLVFSKDTIDPQLFRANKVYGGDAWTPTAPRVDYPVNSKKASQVEHELHRLAGDVSVAGGIFGNSAALRSMGIDNTSTRSTAEMAEKLASTDTVRAAYLADQGKSLEPVKMDKVWDKFGNDTLQKVVDRLGVNTLAEIEANLETGESVKDALGENAEVIRDILRDYYREQGEPMLRRMAVKRHWTDAEINERRQNRIDNSMDGVSIFTLEDIVHHAWDMYQDGGATKGEIDRMATSDALRSSVDDHAVEEWIAGKLDGLLGEAGIYNGKDPYTPSGNLRSFSQLHYAYTLENIVKAMKEGQEERGGNTWGASAKTLQSVATPEYRSIQEIKADSGRLGMDEGTEYEAKLQAIDDQIGSIITKIKQGNKAHSDNSFVESDIIGSILMETSKGKRTVDAIMRAFSKEGYKISSQTAQDIQAVYQEAAEMPTGYFEAKPQRAVGFDEVLAAVIPDNSSDRLKAALQDAGVNTVEYIAGDEADRLEKVNSVDDAAFSREIPEANYETLKEKYGYIPAGERAYREVQVPKKTADDKYVSRTIRTVLEAKATPDAMVPTLERMVAKGEFSYGRYTDKQAISDAESRIKPRVGKRP